MITFFLTLAVVAAVAAVALAICVTVSDAGSL
jgi:hypothetical protein